MPIRRLTLKRESLTQLTPEDLLAVAGAQGAISNAQGKCTLQDNSYRVWLLECTSNTWVCTQEC